MAKAKTRWVAPYLEVSVRAEGTQLLSLVKQEPVTPTADHFSASMQVHALARPNALAVTLIEVAIALIEPTLSYEAERLRHAVAMIMIKDTPMGDFTDDDDEFPF